MYYIVMTVDTVGKSGQLMKHTETLIPIMPMNRQQRNLKMARFTSTAEINTAVEVIGLQPIVQMEV